MQYLTGLAKAMQQTLEEYEALKVESERLKQKLFKAYLKADLFCCDSPSIVEDIEHSRYTCVSCGTNNSREVYETLDRLGKL
jgi:regulator of replication initiation timing